MSTYPAEEITEFVRQANRDLGNPKYKPTNLIPDYCKTLAIIEQLQAELAKAKEENERIFRKGYEAGLREFAWWKDGVQYVGTCGTMLKQAIEEK